MSYLWIIEDFSFLESFQIRGFPLLLVRGIPTVKSLSVVMMKPS